MLDQGWVLLLVPNGDFSSLPDISKWILTIGMILGRLELVCNISIIFAVFLEKLK
jgi:trk system potassium uptake protein TrkH